jgi:hypothetical protein
MLNNKEGKVNTDKFYREYSGHPVSDLKLVHDELRRAKQPEPQRIVYLAGDSSLDNKYWLHDFYDAVNGYENILSPPKMKGDISYHMNKLFSQVKPEYVTINTSVEASTLRERETTLCPQDKFIHSHITDDDILIVSVGGNDIALSPTMATIFNMAMLMYFNSQGMIEAGPRSAWGMNYFIDMFKTKVERYIMSLIGDAKPHKIIVCMIYHPDEQLANSWADISLKYLGYNSNPVKLQKAIEQLFLNATKQIVIPGCNVIPFAMYKVLDGKNSGDYVERVEPSYIGGQKLAKAFVKACLKQ